MKRVIIFLLLFSQSVFANCWDNAGHYYHVDPWLLYAIAKVESGMNPHAVGRRVDAD